MGEVQIESESLYFFFFFFVFLLAEVQFVSPTGGVEMLRKSRVQFLRQKRIIYIET